MSSGGVDEQSRASAIAESAAGRTRRNEAPALREQLPVSVGVPALHQPGKPLELPTLPPQLDEVDEQPPQFEVGELMAEVRSLLDEDEEQAAARWDAAWRETDRDEADAPSSAAEAVTPIAALPPAAGPHGQLRDLARTCLENIGATGMLRTVAGDDLWGHASARFEDRLLRSLDALMGLGAPAAGSGVCLDVAREALAYGQDTFSDDPFRSFAAALVLGCFEDRDAARYQLRGLADLGNDARHAALDALALASNPHLDQAAKDVLSEEQRPEALSDALRLLRLRRVPNAPAAWLMLQHIDDEVRLAAARYLADSPRRSADATRLQNALQREPSGTVMAALLQALLRADRASGLTALRQQLHSEQQHPRNLAAGPRDALLRLLAVAGEEADLPLLQELAGRLPVALEALGWHGMRGAVETLLDELDRVSLDRATSSRPPDRAQTAAEALVRIIGAEPSDPSAREQGAPRNVEAKAWRDLWLQRSGRFKPGCRYRFGATYHWQASHAELLQDGVRQRDRGILALELELALAGGDASRGAVLPIHTWRAVQLRQLDELLDVMAP